MRDLDILVEDLQLVFRQNSNESEAAGMRRYMKELFPYLGLKKPVRAALESDFISECRKLPERELEYVVRKLWNLPEREYQYTAMVLLRKARFWKHEQSIHLFEYLLVNKSWWDSVDGIAAQLAWTYFLAFPGQRNAFVQKWKLSENMWLNRSSIIFQLTYKQKTDIPLLFELLEYFAPQKEFFIKKAVGWALRQLSYTYPDEVIEFCNTHNLQPLSLREAMKALLRNGKI